MKKSTMENLVNYLNEVIGVNGGEEHTKPELVTARDEMVAELSKGRAKAEANRALYAEYHDRIIEILASNAPVTANDIAEETGIPQGKIVYGLKNYWADEVTVDTSGKVNTYTLRV